MWKQLRLAGPVTWVLIALFAFILFRGVVDFFSVDEAQLSKAALSPRTVEKSQPTLPPVLYPTNDPLDQIRPFPSPSSVQNEPRARSSIPDAVVDGVTYTGDEQIEAMTQAARDAGLDEAAAQRTGREAAIMCNGNPDCLR